MTPADMPPGGPGHARRQQGRHRVPVPGGLEGTSPTAGPTSPATTSARRTLTPERLDATWWAIASDHTLLALHLRRVERGHHRVGDRAVHYRTTTAGATCGHPPTATPGGNGGRCRAAALVLTAINGMPARPLTADLDTAIAIGRRVMLGKVDDALMLMPLRNPAGPSHRIVIDSDDDAWPCVSSSAALRPAARSSRCTTPAALGHGRCLVADLEHR